MYQQERNDVEEMEISTYNYFSNVLNITGEEFNDEEGKEIFFRNVFNAMKHQELQLICHKRLSFALENVMTYANEEQLLLLLGIVRDNFTFVASHQNGSHVLQSLLEMSLKHIASSGEDHTKLVKRIVKFGVLVRENLDEMLKCSQSCHVIITMLNILSGYKVTDKRTKSKTAQGFQQKGIKKGEEFGSREKAPLEKVEVPEKFLKVLKKLITNLMKNEDLDGILAKSCSSLVVQTALLVFKKCDPEACHKLVEPLMSKLFDNDMDVISDCVYSPLVQKIIEACTPEQYSSFWDKQMKGKLKEICIHPFANFVAQTLLQNCPSKAELEKMFEELENCWSDITSVGHLGVLVALSSACARLGCCQAKFFQLTRELLQCSEPNKKELFVPLAIRWMRFEDFTDKRNKNQLWKFNFHGSLILQNMLRFQKPFAITESLLAMEPKDLINVFCNASGSHLLDAFAESATVSRVKKNLLIVKLKDHFTRLACDKYGSRCIEKLWKSTDVNGKSPIMEDLAQNQFKLKDNKFGSIIDNIFAVTMYKKRPKDWGEWHNKGLRKKEMFKDILQSETEKPKRKKPKFR